METETVHVYTELGNFLFPIVGEETQNFAKGIYKHILLDMLATGTEKFTDVSLDPTPEEAHQYIAESATFFTMCKKVGLWKESKIEKKVKVTATDVYYEMAKTNSAAEIVKWALGKYKKK
ncbi:MAG: hypothetical protein DRQ88_12000 [Epsilonproteobacteria bacterium]|nr:MAG: hypothetical protein DRQ89_11600 [Campylobacterota bacterium]RLA63762.1 MAG: hypothetical protein DRQ88_12000 [Campylobacterota bacterium]